MILYIDVFYHRVRPSTYADPVNQSYKRWLDLYTSPGNRGVASGTTKLADWLASKWMHASSIGVVYRGR
jgi:hypothetical protein